MKLCIISHTEHYIENKEIVGWGTTVTEINNLLNVFDEIYHVATVLNEKAPASSLPYTSDKIKLVQIPSTGGKTINEKLSILKKMPQIIKTVNETLAEVDCFQFRGPTGIGVFLIPYLTFFVNKPGWFKYAGNWNQDNPPLGYWIQRSLLKKQKRKLTINGKWEDQPKQSLTFENPTLTQNDLIEGDYITSHKNYDKELNFCFVGRLEKPKGVERILKAFAQIKNERLGTLHFVGDGNETSYFKELAKASNIKVVFHGGLARKQVFEIYKNSHVFLLPSTASEGFPKVIAEAMCFGCIPIVSDVSSITQYVKNDENGLVVNPVTDVELKKQIEKILETKPDTFSKLVENNNKVTRTFTFDYYNNRIKNDIIPSFLKK